VRACAGLYKGCGLFGFTWY